MLSEDLIRKKINEVAPLYPLKRVSYFGSYADGNATEKSDLDVLVESFTPTLSLFTLIDFKNKLEDIFNIPVDVIHAPLPEGSMINIERTVNVYEA